MPLKTLRSRIALALLVATAGGAMAYAAVATWLPLGSFDSWLSVAVGFGLLLIVSLWSADQLLAPLRRLVRSLEGAVLSYRDGDFSVSVAPANSGELAELVRHHSALGRALRDQRHDLVQRELLLDTIVQNTPVALVLTDFHYRVVYANIAARQLLAEGRSLEGCDFGEIVKRGPQALQRAVEAGNDALVGLFLDGAEETFHFSLRTFQLQGCLHCLHLFRRMTRELSRQEVATWKRVIRVISHELNNSLAPITSLAHSGEALAHRGDLERLPSIFETIGERAHHLHNFLDAYAHFAKLPGPRPVKVEWQAFLEALASQVSFRQIGPLPKESDLFDPIQMEQALINIIKNAHEAGSPEDEVTLAVGRSRDELRVEISDAGPGMSEAVLTQALLPFYSTKRGGTGLGLALASEIVQAHGGRISLLNRNGGGLKVVLSLPLASDSADRSLLGSMSDQH